MKSIPEETAEALLQGRWLRLRDNANDEAIRLAEEYLFAFWQLGLVDDIGVDGWKARFRRCPGHTGEGGRVWCAYCGEMPASDPEEQEL